MDNTGVNQCVFSGMLVRHGFYIFSQILQIVVCSVTLFTILLWRSFILKQLVNRNAQILMNAILLSIFCHDLVFAGTQLHHILYDFFFVSEDCELIFSNFNCLFVKCLTQCFNINLPLLFICLCVERTVATYSLKKYADNSSIAITLTPIFTFLISISYAGYVFSVDAYDPVDTASCLFNTPTSWLRVNIMYYSLIGVNTTAMIWIFCLYLKNRRLELGIVSLNSRYQIKENIHITKIVLICGSIQLAIALLHEVANTVRRMYVNDIDKILYRELSVFIYSVTYANLFFILILYILLRNLYKRKEEFVDRERGMRNTLTTVAYFPRSW